MLSNPTNNLHNRQRQHRRQHSTPNAFEPVKAPVLPNLQRHGSHRRGISLDQRRRQTPPQDLMVSRTNPGYTTTPQHILRETRQQRPLRPGPSARFPSYDNDENFLQSPAVTPQRQFFDARNQYGVQAQSQYSYPATIDTTMNVDPASYQGANDFNLFSNEGVLTPSSFLDFSSVMDVHGNCESQGHSRRSSAGRRISGGIVDRVAQFEQMALKSPQRPRTPPRKNVSDYFPLTPAETPQHRMIKQEQMNRRFLDSYDTSMEETIKPRGNLRAKGVFEDLRREAEKHMMQNQPSAVPNQCTTNFDSAPMPTGDFMELNNLNLEFLKSEQHHDGLPYSPMVPEISPALSYHSGQEDHDSMYGGQFVNNNLGLKAPAMSYSSSSHSHRSVAPLSPAISSHRRSESVSSINIEESMTETGITIDDIAAFISGPDPADNKWLCLYPECGKRFGRKENIKSHVQTHLGDRQYQCPHCSNRFVRQHDLKRHAKIHSGVKPYPCQCGNSFARHDALTRHRQRGMCIGAFEGVVKKVVKRGRPRKNRPDDEKRVEKSSRTRARNKAKAMSSASSSTGYTSESADGHSPRSEADILDDKPFGDFDYSQAQTAATFQYSDHDSPAPVDCVSPQDIQASSPTPNDNQSQKMSRVSSVQSIASSQQLPVLPASPAKSSQSYHSPPGLCESSSSPAASHYYELDNLSNHGEDITKLSLANISEDDEIFLEAFANNAAEISTLERDPGLLLGKFDDSYAQDGDMFRDTEDVFFGSP